MKTALFNRCEIEESLGSREILEAIEKTFIDLALGKTTNPPKLTLDLGALSNYPPYGGFINAMPAYVGWLDVAGLKWAGAIPERVKLGHSSITGMLMLLEPRTGNFLAVMDGLAITELRFAAQDVVALKYLTDKKEIDVGFLGGGEQVLLHLKFLKEYFSVRNVYVDVASDIKKEAYDSLIYGEIKFSMPVPELVSNSDAVFGIGKSKAPVIRKEDLRKGAVVFPLGSYNRWCQEDVLIGESEILVDHMEQCLEKGELSSLVREGKLDASCISSTIGDLVTKGIQLDPNKTKICIPLGMGALDIALGGICYLKMKALCEGFDFQNYV